MPVNMMATAIDTSRSGHGVAPAHARQNSGKDEKKEQRLHADAHEEGNELPRQHARIAQKQSHESLQEDA
jgi:hypothetical protein